MELWVIVAVIMTLPYLMLLTARAVHQDERLPQGAHGWLAAGVVLLPVLIPVYWVYRLSRRSTSPDV